MFLIECFIHIPIQSSINDLVNGEKQKRHHQCYVEIAQDG